MPQVLFLLCGEGLASLTVFLIFVKPFDLLILLGTTTCKSDHLNSLK